MFPAARTPHFTIYLNLNTSRVVGKPFVEPLRLVAYITADLPREKLAVTSEGKKRLASSVRSEKLLSAALL